MISVCMATYNGGKYIKKQVDSILSQLGARDELIVSDDNSTDNTVALLESFNDPRIKIFRNQRATISGRSKSFYCASSNFGNALKYAKGDYIFFSDQDDIWVEGRVEKMIDGLNENLLVVCNFVVIDSQDAIRSSSFYHNNPTCGTLLNRLKRMPFFGCCMAFRRELLDVALPFPPQLIMHDNWVGFIAVKLGQVKFIQSPPLHLYRRHDENVSMATNKSSNSLWYKLYYRWKFYRLYCKRVKNRRS